MSIKLLTKQLLRTWLLVILSNGFALVLSAQEPVTADRKDSLTADTILTHKTKPKKEKLESEIKYSARDSILFDLPEKKVYLFGDAAIFYKDIKLNASYVEIDFKDNTVLASGLPDSTGKVTGTPEFSEGSHTFRSKKMLYNFDTRKGIIQTVITKEGEGYIHGNVIKKMSDSVINIRAGKYTTCNLEHPHYEFRFDRSKVLTDNKIVTGPAYLSVAGVPTPLAIPFGLFPNKKGQRSGIILPTYGESSSRGFYFENFGYYFGLNQYLDLELRGDIYTLGSWATKASSRYAKRYHYTGFFNVSYANNKLGVEGSPDYQNYRDFAVRWVHNQSDKARPNSRFSSNVNVMSSKFNKFNPVNTNAYLSNTFQSSISYQTNWDQKYFLVASVTHSQNTIEKTVAMTLPDLAFSVNRFYPFSRKNRVGSARWYEKISVNYQSSAQNTINTYDSLLFKPGSASKYRNGVQHSVAVSSPLKILKFFVLNNSITYKERWYSKKVEKKYFPATYEPYGDTMITDTVQGFFATHDYTVSSSLSTILYGLVQFRKGPLKGIRHVLTPSVSFNYAPGFGKSRYGYYKYYMNEDLESTRYSVFEGALYGYPVADPSGRVSFNLMNNLEIKVRSKKDTASGYRKIPLVENFTLSTSYDLARDSLNWAPLTMAGRTRLFKDINITYASTWDPYILDSTGSRNLNRFEWNENHRMVRLKNTAWNFSLNWNLRSKTKKDNKNRPATDEENAEVYSGPDSYVDFNIPWTFNVSYSLRHNINILYPYLVRTREQSTVQTFDFYGDINITPKWKIGVRSGYDFTAKTISYTSVDFYRDLHCWEMRFNWVPVGFRKSWSFTINVKSQVLQDLKLNKKKDFRDY